MRMRRLLWTLIGAAALVCAQEKKEPQREKISQKFIEVKYADANRIASLIQTPGVSIRSDDSMHAIIVLGTSETVAALEDMVKKLDVAPPNVELTVYLVSGSSQGAADELPQDLASAAKQLHGLFQYKRYRMLESFVLRGRDGREGNTSGILPGSSSAYDFRYRSATVSGGTPRVVHINGMGLLVRTPTGGRNQKGEMEYRNAGLNTDIDVAEGQKVVVGKSSVNGSDEAMILIVTAKVVQ